MRSTSHGCLYFNLMCDTFHLNIYFRILLSTCEVLRPHARRCIDCFVVCVSVVAFDCVFLYTSITLQAHVKKGAMSRAIEEFKPESFLKRLSENGHLVGYAAYIEVELGGLGDDGDGGAYAVDAELSSSSSSLSGLRYVDWCISRCVLFCLITTP